MPLPLIPIAVATALGAGWLASGKKQPKDVSPQTEAVRRHIYMDAMTSKGMTGKQLRELADTYRSQGLKAEAMMLVRRAELTEASPELKEARREALRKALRSTDVQAVREMASLFEESGAFGACHRLREYANTLEIEQNKARSAPTPTEAGNGESQT